MSILIAIAALYFGFLVAVAIKLGRIRPSSGRKPMGLSVIVPFRNDSENLKELMPRLQKGDARNPQIEFIFVNDNASHADFDCPAIGEGFRFIATDSSAKGKKNAIRKGVMSSKYDWILTLDADARPHPGFFDSLLLPKEKNTKMRIFPIVPTKSKGPARAFFDLEFLALQGVGRAMAGWKTPILANGACLLFDKAAFLEVDSDRGDYHLPTGDDVFLMMALTKQFGPSAVDQAPIRAAMNVAFPNGVNTLLNQRARWISKTIDVRDARYGFMACAMALVHLLLLPGAVAMLFGLDIVAGLTILGLKVSAEWILFGVVLPGFRRRDLFRFLPFAQMCYPLYVGVLISLGVLKRLDFTRRKLHIIEKV
jgi:cellulose synthase/poly-beta-1,6-N-acetylglucosamine synthase-like glycosyltransferase